MAKLFLLFLIVPTVEIYFLIEIGSQLGAAFTIAMIILTAIIGAGLVRFQGVTTLARAQGELLQKRMPTMEVIEGAMILLAGVLLLIPGFFTDAVGFILLISPLRQLLVRRFLKSKVVNTSPTASTKSSNDRIIDIDYKDLD